jgi:transposase
MLDHRKAYKIRKTLSKIAPVSFTHEPSDRTILGVMHFTQIIGAGLTTRPFLMISAFCLVQMIRFNIDPFTFSPPGMISLMTLFLRGKTVCLRHTDDTQQLRLSQLVKKMNGVVRDDADADYIICAWPLRISQTATIVHPAWLDALFSAKQFVFPRGFNPGPMQRIPRKPEAIDREIASCLASRIPWPEIAENIHVSMSGIQSINEAMGSGETFVKHKRPGRPSKMTTQVVSEVRDMTTEDPYLGSRKLTTEIAERLGVSLSAQTINSIRKMLHFNYQLPRKCLLITETQEEKRVAFCEKSLAGDIDWASQVIISDESRFGLDDDSRRMWVQRGVYNDRTLKPTPKHNASFMVWGAIGKGFKSKLIFIDGNPNADGYQKILTESKVLDDMNGSFRESKGYFQ